MPDTSSDAVPAKAERACPLCGGKIDDGLPVVRTTKRNIRIAAAVIPVGVIVAAAGELLAYFVVSPAFGHGLIGAGITMALLSALYVKMLD